MNFLSKLFGGPSIDLKPLLDQGAVIIDVRQPEEFRGGHVAGSINIPLPDLDRRMKEIKAFKKPIIACCATGNRSGMAASKLKGLGLEAYNGGGWREVASQVERAGA